MRNLWQQAERHAGDFNERNEPMSHVDDVRNAASALMKPCLETHALREAARGGFRVSGAPASAQVIVKPDPGLLARTRCVVRGDGTVTVEILDPVRESWAEVYRSDVPDLIATDAPLAGAEAPTYGPLGPPQAGQIVWKDGRLQVYRPEE
jgi:hypothetical protein